MEITTHSTEETKKLAEQVASTLKGGMVLALYGELGAGKTTFTSFLVKALGSNSRVQSPTFVIARKYICESTANSGIEKIYHLDLYRLKTKEELDDLDIHQFLKDDTAITLVEWPEIAEKLLPENSIKIRFNYIDENSRSLDVKNSN